MNRLLQVWHSIQEPRHKKLAAGCAYIAATLVGVNTLRDPPQSIEGLLGVALTYGWGSLYLIGGVLAVGTVLQGWWWCERLGIYTIVGGVIIYLGVIAYLDVAATEGNRMPQYWAITITVPLLVYRWFDIWRLPYEPRRR